MKMVAKEEHEITAGTTADSSGSVSDPSDSGQDTNSSQHIGKNLSKNIEAVKYVTVQPIEEEVQYNSRVQEKSNSRGKRYYFNRLPIAISPNRQVMRRLPYSPKKKTAMISRNAEGGTRSEVFMEPPVRKSGSKHSLDRQTTATTLSSSSLTMASFRTSETLSQATSAHSVALAPTKSLSSNRRIPKMSVEISGLIHPPSGDSINTQTGLSVPYYVKRATPSSSTMASESETMVSMKTAGQMKLKLDDASGKSMTSRSRDCTFWKPKATTQSFRSRTPKKVTTAALRAARDSSSPTDEMTRGNESQDPGKNETSTGGKKEEKKKAKDNKPQTTVTEASGTTNSDATSRGSKQSKKSKRSKGKGKASKKGKEKVKKLNRKVIYKEMKAIEKRMEEEAKNRKKMEWEKHKLFFYWNCVVKRLHDLQRRHHGLKKKKATLKMEKRDGMFHHNWKTMNLARLQREECLDQKRAEFRSMIRELRDSHKRQTDWLFKDIQTYVKDTYLVGQKYVNDVVGIRMEYTKGLTDTIFEARENLRVLEIEQNSKYRPALEEFEEQMQKLRSKIPTERQERLQKMLAESNRMLVELVNVYTTILHHNFIEVCHTANIINQLKSDERRLEREMNDMVKKRDKIKERTEYLHERVSNLRRQVNSGREARKKLHRVMKDQEVLQNKIDLAYISKEMTYQENSRLTQALQETSERVDRWYFTVKRDFIKDIILEAAKHEERASQLMNYNYLVKYLFNVESDFLETIENFKDHEEFDDQQEGLKVLLGVYRPHTIYDLEREFEGCTESFTTAIIFFKRRLQQHYMSLDDLDFFIKRRNPLSYLNKVRKEESELKQLMTLTLGSRYALHNKRQHGQSSMVVASSQTFKW